MTQRGSPAILAAINYHQICLIFVVSIVWLTQDACAQPAMDGVNTLGGMQRQGTRQQNDMQQLLLNELLNNVNEDALYNELKNYQRQQPNYPSKLPALRDLLAVTDYGDENDDSSDGDAIFDAANVNLIERLRQLAANSVNGIDDIRSIVPDVRPIVPPLKKKPQKSPAGYKDHGIKKNIQYMSPCHFKICNMGRKRNARFFEV